jgi:hypothetical protein
MRMFTGMVGAAALLAAVLGNQRAGAVSLALSPASQSVATSGVLDVDVVITELGAGAAPTLAAFDLDITFDPSLLSFGSVDFGFDLGIPGLEALTSAGLLAGPVRVDLAEASLLSNAALDLAQPASFVLATLHFVALAPGVSPLAITQAVLADTAGGPGNNSIAASLSGASVTVVPEPSTALLLALGVALLGHRVERSLRR